MKRKKKKNTGKKNVGKDIVNPTPSWEAPRSSRKKKKEDTGKKEGIPWDREGKRENKKKASNWYKEKKKLRGENNDSRWIAVHTLGFPRFNQ